MDIALYGSQPFGNRPVSRSNFGKRQVKPYATWARIAHLCVCSVSSIGDGVYNFTNIPLPEDEAARWVEEAQRRGEERRAPLAGLPERQRPREGAARGGGAARSARHFCESLREQHHRLHGGDRRG